MTICPTWNIQGGLQIGEDVIHEDTKGKIIEISDNMYYFLSSSNALFKLEAKLKISSYDGQRDNENSIVV
jgi:hypothetical protein